MYECAPAEALNSAAAAALSWSFIPEAHHWKLNQLSPFHSKVTVIHQIIFTSYDFTFFRPTEFEQ